MNRRKYHISLYSLIFWWNSYQTVELRKRWKWGLSKSKVKIISYCLSQWPKGFIAAWAVSLTNSFIVWFLLGQFTCYIPSCRWWILLPQIALFFFGIQRWQYLVNQSLSFLDYLWMLKCNIRHIFLKGQKLRMFWWWFSLSAIRVGFSTASLFDEYFVQKLLCPLKSATSKLLNKVLNGGGLFGNKYKQHKTIVVLIALP